MAKCPPNEGIFSPNFLGEGPQTPRYGVILIVDKSTMKRCATYSDLDDAYSESCGQPCFRNGNVFAAMATYAIKGMESECVSFFLEPESEISGIVHHSCSGHIEIIILL